MEEGYHAREELSIIGQSLAMVREVKRFGDCIYSETEYNCTI